MWGRRGLRGCWRSCMCEDTALLAPPRTPPPIRLCRCGLTALHCAACSGHAGVLGDLLAKGASVNMRARDGSTALHLAAARCNPDAVRCLVSNGGSVVAKDFAGWV